MRLFSDFEQYRDLLAGKDIMTSRDFCRQLPADTGVAILPESDFGRDEKELTARIAYIDFSGREALDNYPVDKDIDDSFVETYCARTIEAFGRLVNWLQKL